MNWQSWTKRNSTFIKHFIDGKGRLVATLICDKFRRDENIPVDYGFSIVNKKDRPIKEQGRKIAYGRYMLNTVKKNNAIPNLNDSAYAPPDIRTHQILQPFGLELSGTINSQVIKGFIESHYYQYDNCVYANKEYVGKIESMNNLMYQQLKEAKKLLGRMARYVTPTRQDIELAEVFIGKE